MFDSIDKAHEMLINTELHEMLINTELDEFFRKDQYEEDDEVMDNNKNDDAKDDIIFMLVKTLEYYANSKHYHNFDNSIFVDQGQRARITLKKYQEYRDAYDVDMADKWDMQQAHKGFCSDIKLPKGFKFIEINETEEKNG